MKYFFFWLTGPLQKNDVPVIFALKVWLTISFGLVGFLFFAGKILPIIPSLLLCCFILKLICSYSNDAPRSECSFLISFPSIYKIAFFVVIVAMIIAGFALLFGYIFSVNYAMYSVGPNRISIFYGVQKIVDFIKRLNFIPQFWFDSAFYSLLGFFVFRKLLQIGLCGVRIEKK